MKKNNKVARLCINAVLAALFVIFELISLDIGNQIKITFGGFPIIISAVLFGPIDGMIVGFVGSFIGQIMEWGLTPTTILWVIPAAVRGLLMGILFKAFKKSEKPLVLGVEVLFSSLVVTALNTVITIIDATIMSYPSGITIGVTAFRFISSIITAVIYTILVSVIIKAIRVFLKK